MAEPSCMEGSYVQQVSQQRVIYSSELLKCPFHFTFI